MSKSQPRSYSELYGNRAGAPAPQAVAPSPSPSRSKTANAATRRGTDTVDWANEYRQVFGDLRHLFIITAALFALMIVLGFVL